MTIALATACADEGVDDSDLSGADDLTLLDAPATAAAEVAETSQGLVTVNGLRTINGLRTVNGLITVNGLSTENGLRTVNGLRTINGLRTVNGVRTVNGLQVDCAGVDESACTGEPDGLLDNRTGLMATPGGVDTASFVVRCALGREDGLRVRDYSGALVNLSGELGLTPEWKDGQCDTTCQEKISACLMAFTNGNGEHIELEMTAQFTLGTRHSREFPFQEAAFFGNLFVDPPQAFYCVGADYAETGITLRLLETRSCRGYNDKDGVCPYLRVGFCNSVFGFGGVLSRNLADSPVLSDRRCDFRGGAARSCIGGAGRRGTVWRNPITTYRRTRE